MTSKRNLSLYVLIVLSCLAAYGLVVLVVLTADGVWKIGGVALGAGYGVLFGVGFLVGRAIYGGEKRRNLKGLLIFLAGQLSVGLVYLIGWHLPYMAAHPSSPALTFVEQFAGMLWVHTLAGVYLAYQGYRRADGS